MGKKQTKKRYNFTIDEASFEEFRAYCKEHCINMSAKIEKYIRDEVRT
jgi:post-segregation antitoxin (ccd killing protein)